MSVSILARSTITNLVALLDLPPELQEGVRVGQSWSAAQQACPNAAPVTGGLALVSGQSGLLIQQSQDGVAVVKLVIASAGYVQDPAGSFCA